MRQDLLAEDVARAQVGRTTACWKEAVAQEQGCMATAWAERPFPTNEEGAHATA